jgi:hypothetical protein
VPVIVDNLGHVFDTVMVAGMIGIQAIPTREAGLGSIQPVSGWFMYEKKKRACAKTHNPVDKPPRVLDWSLVRQGK